MGASVVATRYWHLLEDGRVQCDLCPRACKLHRAQHGLCFVRERQRDEIVLTTFGRSSGFCVDPIEKKPLNHFLPGSPVLSFGTAGCNLACRFCQNWDISKAREVKVLADEASPETIARAARDLGCRSVAFTYNDPVVFHEYAIAVAEACREMGVRTVAVTAGYVCDEPRREFYSHMDAANIDLKAFSEDFYRRVCAGHLDPVLETLDFVVNHTDVWVEITTLLIPGLNDGATEVRELSEWIVEHLGADVPLHFTAFHPDFKMLDRPPTPPRTLSAAQQIAVEAGVHHVYTGNVWDPSGQRTVCSGCSALLIGRDGYHLTRWNLTEGRCPSCGTACPGVFESSPGSWGARRLPVRLSDFRIA